MIGNSKGRRHDEKSPKHRGDYLRKRAAAARAKAKVRLKGDDRSIVTEVADMFDRLAKSAEKKSGSSGDLSGTSRAVRSDGE